MLGDVLDEVAARHFDGAQSTDVWGLAICASSSGKPLASSMRHSAINATFDPFVARLNIDSPKNMRPSATP